MDIDDWWYQVYDDDGHMVLDMVMDIWWWIYDEDDIQIVMNSAPPKPKAVDRKYSGIAVIGGSETANNICWVCRGCCGVGLMAGSCANLLYLYHLWYPLLLLLHCYWLLMSIACEIYHIYPYNINNPIIMVIMIVEVSVSMRRQSSRFSILKFREQFAWKLHHTQSLSSSM